MFSRLTVARRLYVGFALILSILLVVAAVSVVKVQIINEALRANSEQHGSIQR